MEVEKWLKQIHNRHTMWWFDEKKRYSPDSSIRPIHLEIDNFFGNINENDANFIRRFEIRLHSIFFISNTVCCEHMAYFFFTSFNLASAFVRSAASIESVAFSVCTKLTASILLMFSFFLFLSFQLNELLFLAAIKINCKSNDWKITPNQTHKKLIKKNSSRRKNHTPGNARCSSSMTQALIIRLLFGHALKCDVLRWKWRRSHTCVNVPIRTSNHRATRDRAPAMNSSPGIFGANFQLH